MRIFSRALRLAVPLFLGLVFSAPGLSQVAPQSKAYSSPAIVRHTPWLYKGSDLPHHPDWTFGVLPNGLRYAVRHNGVPPGQVSIRVRIGAGSLMETDAQRGYAHLIEHLSFRGSAYAGDNEAKRIWQRLGVTFGSDSNAQTTFTQTVYQLDLPSATRDSLDETMHLLAGMIQKPDLDQKALDAERPVVMAEKREQPGPQVKFDDASRELFFAGQPLANRSPIGTDKTLLAATPAKVRTFHDRWYRPDNTLIVIVGDMDPAIFEQMIARHFADWKGIGPDPKMPDFGKPKSGEPVADHTVEPLLPTLVSMAWVRPWTVTNDTYLFNQNRMVDLVAARIVNRRLERRARAGGSFIQAGVDVSDMSRSANITNVTILPIGDDWKAAVRDVRAVIADAEASPPTQAEIDREVAEVEATMKNMVATSAVEAGSDQADNMVDAVDIHETVVAPQTSLDILEQAIAKKFFTPARVLASSRHVFSGTALRAVVNTPKPVPNIDAEIRAALQADVNGLAGKRHDTKAITFADLPSLGPPGTVTATKTVLKDPEIQQVDYANGVHLLMRTTSAEVNRVFVVVRFGRGYNAMPNDRMTPAWAGDLALMASGIAGFGQDELDRLTGDRQMGMDFYIDNDAFVLFGKTTEADLEDQLKLFAEKLAHPGWDPNPVKRARAVTLVGYNADSSSAERILSRDLKGLLHDGDPRWTAPSREQVAALTPETFRAFWEPILASGPIEVEVFGDAKQQHVIDAVAATFGALKPRPASDAQPPAIRFPKHDANPVVLHHDGKADQAAAIIAWPTGGGSAGIPESRKLDVLAAIFRDRLLDQLRSQAGASYTPMVNSDWPLGVPAGGRIVAVGLVPPDKTDLFFRLSRGIAADLIAKPVSQDELERSLKPLMQTLMRNSTGSGFWMLQSGGGSFDPARIAAINTLGDDYVSVTPAEIQALARKYLQPSSDFTAVVLPSKSGPKVK